LNGLVLPQPRKSRDWKSTLLIVGLIAPIVTASIVAYNTWYNVPVMTYEILPAYPVSQQEQAVALIVRNEGAASATDMRIVIRGSGQISLLSTQIQEECKITTQNSTLVVTLPRFPRGTQISLFLKVQAVGESPITSVYISSLQGIGGRHSSTGTPDAFSTAKDLLAVLGGIFILVIIYSVASAGRRKRETPATRN
jgi:hypothetical protein